MTTKILFFKASPTRAQAEAGNYKKRKLSWNGLTISIENEVGSIRKGNGWQTKMVNSYGYINRTEAVDGDQVDVYLGPDESADTVYVVHQRRYSDWSKYDEDKAMLNFSSEAEAKVAYLKHYDDPRFLGPITAMPVAEFVEKAKATKDAPKMIKAVHAGDTRTGDLFAGGTHIEARTRKDGVVQGYHVSETKKTETPQFKRWFGESRVTRDGEPLIMYHASYRDFDTFDHRASVKWRRMETMDTVGSWFSDNPSREGGAGMYANGEGAAIYPVYLSIQKPKHYAAFDDFLNDMHRAAGRDPSKQNPKGVGTTEELRNKLKAEGYDGIVFGRTYNKQLWEHAEKLQHQVKEAKDAEWAVHRSERAPLTEKREQLEKKLREWRNKIGPNESTEFDNQQVWIAFDSHQIKSASGNNGDYGQVGDMTKSITLIFPSGNEHELSGDEFSFGADDSMLKALEAGQRWITVHPNGRDGKGVPVMVQESHHGSGVFHVIGGAGGKLNYLKLRGLKPESSYKEHAAERSKAKREQKKVAAARDKELGLEKGKAKAKESVKMQQTQADKAFIQKVADKMGWKPEELEPNIPDTISEVAQTKLVQKHHSELLKRANEAVDLQQQNLMTDVMAREEAGVALVPDEHTPPEQLTVADLDDARPQAKSGIGFAAHYAERAADNGASEEDIKQEAGAKKESRRAEMTDNQRSAIESRGDKASQIKAEIESIREPVTANVKAVLVEAKDAVDLIKARKEWKSLQKAAQAANKDIDESVEVKAYNLEVSAPDDSDIEADIESDLRTIRTRAFLSAIDKETTNPEKEMRQHIGAGAFNSINALALTAGGNALIDRSVVDVLGIDGAAQVLARRLHADLPADEMEKLTAGMEDWHVHRYMEASKEAMQEAQSLQDAAKEIGLGEASHGDDFEACRELNRRKKDAIEQSHKILGTALGEMEANAALVTALKGGRNDKSLEVPLGKIADEDAIRQARAIGLQRGDYSIDKVGGNQVLTVTPQGMDRLSKPVDREEMERTRNTLSILNGEQDEDDWLPQGFANRPDLAMDLKPGVAATLAKPFAPSGDMQQSLKDYIGGRAADGDSPADIVADIQSSDFFQKSGDNDAYREALDAVAPIKGKDGKMARAESLADAFNEYADSFVQREYGGKISTLQRQQFEPDHVAQDALHRALSDEPAGIAAYKPIGELTNDDQRTLREFFYANVAKEDPQAASLREKLEGISAHEPEKESVDMFGDTSINPEWHDWKAQRDTLAEEVGAASLDWQKYAGAMHGHENAYASMQDLIRSKVGKSFNEHYNKLNPSAPLKLGRQVIRGNLNHLDAIDPKARAEREAKERELTDSLRERVQGKYASGSVSDKLDAERERREAFNQSQMGFFSTEQEPDMFGDAPKVEKPLGGDERYTLGHAAERTIAGMMPLVGHNFKPGQPVKIFNPTMSGPEGVLRQRAIKFIAANKRMSLSAGVGSGKTAMMLGAYSHLQSQGQAKKGIIVCPSTVIGGVGADALRFMEPGKFKWHCEPGASFEERMAAYKDPDTHFSVVTHQSFRDDLLKMASMKTGEPSGAIAEKMGAMSRKERAAYTKEVLGHHGIDFDFTAIDEGHNLLDRAGKENSMMSNVIGGVTDNAKYMISSTADVIKNDVSELHSALEKIDPEKYTSRDEFMRRYGVDTEGAKASLKREMLNKILPFKIEPKVRADKKEIQVKPTEAQNTALADLDKNIGRVRMARMTGKTDVEAMKAISPGQFRDAPEDQHEAIAKELSGSLGIIKGSAVRAIIDAHPESAKIDALAKIAGERKGKPGVVFAHSLEAVQNIKKRLEADGHRVITLTGGDSSADKAAKIRGFNPDKGDRTHDIMIASDAGATGANLQSGQWLTQFDTSHTAMTHAQRNGRIHRVGQKNDVELLDLVADHPSERAARARLKTKYALRELMSSPYEAGDDTGLAHFLHQRKVQQQADSLF